MTAEQIEVSVIFLDQQVQQIGIVLMIVFKGG